MATERGVVRGLAVPGSAAGSHIRAPDDREHWLLLFQPQGQLACHSRSLMTLMRLVKLSRQLIAALMLFAWLCAGAHVTLKHGGEEFGSHIGEAEHGGHHHDEEPAPGEDDHHHDLGAVMASQFAKAAEQQFLTPQWVPICDRLVAQLAALLREVDARHEHSVVGDSPPDTRTSGWLFVVQTARPVRGPSLAA